MNVFEKLSSELQESIKKMGIETPTKIQEGAIPAVVEGKDVLGESATGSGKTLAFGCGVVENVVPHAGLQALILTPTRELAEQVKESLKKLSYHKQLKITSVYGGVGMENQVRDLKKAEVVVATPGRTLDHLQRGTINLEKISFFVLDEADRMLDMGFIDDVEKIMRACPKERQTLFFSATLDSRIKQLAKKYTRDPVHVSATKEVDPSKLKQEYYNVQRNMKLALLVHLLEQEKAGLVMVFCNTRRTTDFVVKNLKRQKINATAIHGGLTQNKRTKTIDMFNNAKVSVLVCTDVAARGLHIDNVSHVYNYELPKDSKDYVHRIGRTARAGEEGKVINLLAEQDHDNFGRIQRDYRNLQIEKRERPYLKRVEVVMEDAPERRGGFSRGRPSGRSGGFRRTSDRSDDRRGNNRSENRGQGRFGERSERGDRLNRSGERSSSRFSDRSDRRPSNRSGERSNNRFEERSDRRPSNRPSSGGSRSGSGSSRSGRRPGQGNFRRR